MNAIKEKLARIDATATEIQSIKKLIVTLGADEQKATKRGKLDDEASVQALALIRSRRDLAIGKIENLEAEQKELEAALLPEIEGQRQAFKKAVKRYGEELEAAWIKVQLPFFNNDEKLVRRILANVYVPTLQEARKCLVRVSTGRDQSQSITEYARAFVRNAELVSKQVGWV
jgi:hypothetical protein